MKQLRENQHVVWVGLAVLILLAEAAGFVHNWRRLEQSQAWFTHTYRTIDQLNRVLSEIKDAETGQRGYVLTGREEYLEPYERTLAVLPAGMAELRNLANTPDQVKRVEELDGLVSAKIAELRRTVELRRSAGLKAAAGLIETDDGMRLMQGIRNLVSDIRAGEDAELERRTREADAFSRWAYAINGGGWAVLLVLFLGAGVSTHREMRRRQRLVEISRRQAHIIQSAHEAITVRDRMGRILSWNTGAVELYGWTEPEAAGRNIHELLRSELPIERDELYRVLEREGRWDGEIVHRDRYGRTLTVESRQVLVRDERGQPMGILEMNRDITGHKQAEEALRLSRERLEMVVGSIDLGLFYCDLPFDKLVWNDISKRQFGFAPGDEISIDSFYERVHPEDRKSVRQAIERAIHTGAPYDAVYRVLPPGAPVRWIRAIGRAFYDSSGAPVRFDGVAVDITAQRRAEAELRDGRERLMAALSASGTGTFRRRIGDGGLEWDENMYRLLGAGAQDAPRDTDALLELIHPDDRDRMAAALDAAADMGAELKSEFRIVLPDGSVRWIAARARTFAGLPGEPSYMTGACLDITDRKRQEENLRQTQKLESVGLLAGGIAHDFNNLLVGIMGNASLAAETFQLEPREREILDQVIQASERAADLTRQLLAYAGKGRFYVEPVDLSQMIQDTGGLIRASIPKKVALTMDLAAVHPVEADRVQMQQVVMNLVINAGEAVGDREGTVRVSTAARTVDQAYASTFGAGEIAPGEYVELEVQDTGCGMDDHTLARIFDPFFTTKFTGRGLGLAAVQGIVRSHKGALRVYSWPGAGTVFKLLFPASAGAVTRRAPVDESAEDLLGHGTVLVVDDEAAVRQAAKTALSRYGYRVLLATNGREGVEMLRREGTAVSVVVLDLTMPVMNGEEALPAMRAVMPGVQVLLSSGFNEADAVRHFEGKYLSGFIQKPYTAAQLARAVRMALDGPRAASTS